MSIYIGIDWSQDKHDVAFMNAAGAIIARLTIPHQPDGFRKLETTRQQLAVTAADCLVGLETAHNLLLDFLWDHGYLCVSPDSGRYHPGPVFPGQLPARYPEAFFARRPPCPAGVEVVRIVSRTPRQGAGRS